MQTSVADIYAVGDAVACENFVTNTPDYIPLAGPANKQGRIAADNIAGIRSEYKGTQGSSIMKIFDLTVATTGINEKSAALRKIPYDKTYLYGTSHASFYPGSTNMSIKIIWNKKSRRILGAQIVGFEGVDKRMDVIATAIRLGARVTDLASLELCYAPPFGSAKDPINLLGFMADNIINGRLKQLFWHDVEKIPRNGSGILIDVRSETEFKRGHINGAINIPLERFREFAHRIPESKPVYIYCQSGHRSYLACRILMGVGHKRTYNLAGGWRLYDAVMAERALLGIDYRGLLT
jgi:rhodanese-related sulfurtransferase